MGTLPTQALPAVPHLVFVIFNLAVPNVIAWIAVIAFFFVAAWLRLPKIFEGKEDMSDEPDKKNAGNRKG